MICAGGVNCTQKILTIKCLQEKYRSKEGYDTSHRCRAHMLYHAMSHPLTSRWNICDAVTVAHLSWCFAEHRLTPPSSPWTVHFFWHVCGMVWFDLKSHFLHRVHLIVHTVLHARVQGGTNVDYHLFTRSIQLGETTVTLLWPPSTTLSCCKIISSLGAVRTLLHASPVSVMVTCVDWEVNCCWQWWLKIFCNSGSLSEQEMKNIVCMVTVTLAWVVLGAAF